MKLKEGLRTIFLAGVGAVAITGEKASVIIDDLVKKGELTVEEGKVLNEEFAKKAKENLNPENIQKNVKELITTLDEMTKEQRDALRSMLDRLDKKEKEEAEADADEVIDAIVKETTADETVEAADAEVDQAVVNAVAEGDAEALADAIDTVEEIVDDVVADETAEAADEEIDQPVVNAVAEGDAEALAEGIEAVEELVDAAVADETAEAEEAEDADPLQPVADAVADE